MYVWHKEAKSKKFKVLTEHSSDYRVQRTEADLMFVPKAEYEPCPAPEHWINIGDDLRVGDNGTALVTTHGKVIARIVMPEIPRRFVQPALADAIAAAALRYPLFSIEARLPV